MTPAQPLIWPNLGQDTFPRAPSSKAEKTCRFQTPKLPSQCREDPKGPAPRSRCGDVQGGGTRESQRGPPGSLTEVVAARSTHGHGLGSCPWTCPAGIMQGGGQVREMRRSDSGAREPPEPGRRAGRDEPPRPARSRSQPGPSFGA